MSHLKNEFAREKGYSWNCNISASADYIEWLEAKVEKFTSTNSAMDAICECCDAATVDIPKLVAAGCNYCTGCGRKLHQ